MIKGKQFSQNHLLIIKIYANNLCSYKHFAGGMYVNNLYILKEIFEIKIKSVHVWI